MEISCQYLAADITEEFINLPIYWLFLGCSPTDIYEFDTDSSNSSCAIVSPVKVADETPNRGSTTIDKNGLEDFEGIQVLCSSDKTFHNFVLTIIITVRPDEHYPS